MGFLLVHLHLRMAKSRKCKACGRPFAPDVRNTKTQAYCTKPDCQRQRRTLAQRLRRHLVRPNAPPTRDAPDDARRLHAASVFSEADIRDEHPVIIGLISMLIGSDDFSSVEATYRKLWIQGLRIVSDDRGPQMPISPIINMFEEITRRSHGAG